MASSSVKSDRRISYLKALNETLDQEMGRDPSVVFMGEDVAGGAGKEDQGIIDAWGGAFGYSKGLISKVRFRKSAGHTDLRDGIHRCGGGNGGHGPPAHS